MVALRVMIVQQPQGLHLGRRGPLHGLAPPRLPRAPVAGIPSGRAAAAKAPAAGRFGSRPTWLCEFSGGPDDYKTGMPGHESFEGSTSGDPEIANG